MDSLAPNNDTQTQSANDFNKSLKHQRGVEGKIRSASDDMNKKHIPQSTKDKVLSNEDKCKMNRQKRPSISCEAQAKDKCVTELFPWLDEATECNSKYLGSLTEVKPRNVLTAMDAVIAHLSADHDKYCKSPKISRALAGYCRRFLYAYHYLYTGFEKGKDYFQRIARILATYTDLELLASVLGKELDSDVTNRIHMNYVTYLQYADETSILDVLINVKRICRLHGGILNPLLRHNLVKLSVTVPVEVTDDIYIKHLISFKKWLAIVNFSEERQSIRRAFISQVKPQKSLGSNSTYAPYLPAEKETTTPTENFVHLLDTKYSLEPLIQAFKPSPSNDQSNLLAKKVREIVILSDDEDDTKNSHSSNVKIEPLTSTSRTILNTSNASSSSNMVDLTDEVYDETDVPRHYIYWLADLSERARAQAKTIHQRLEVANVSDDIIVIDDSEEVEEANNDEPVISTQHEPQNENLGTELCSELNDSNATQISNNQFDQHEQTNDRSTKKQSNNSNEQSTDSISLDVSQFDGGVLSPLKNKRTDRISSCSDMTAEQITNNDLGNEEVSEQQAPTDKIVANTELTPFVEQMTATTITTNDEIIDDSVNKELLINNVIPMPTISAEPVMTEENVMNEDSVDNTRTDQHLTEQSSIQDDHLTKNYRSNATNRVNNVEQSTITVVTHPTRHNQWNDNNESNPMNNEHDVPNTTQCSIPLAQIKTNTLMLRNSDDENKRPEQSQQNDKIDIDSTNSDRNGKLILKSIQKMSPNPNSDRTMSRSAQAATNDTNNISDNNVPSVIRRKVTEQIDNENIPSTIMERKTYIKPVNVGIKSTNKSQQQINGRQIGSQDDQQQQQQQQQHKQTTPSKNAAIASVQQPPQTFKVFYSGTDINLGLNDLGKANVMSSDCSSQLTNQTQMTQTTTTNATFCESDNNFSCTTENEPKHFMNIAKSSPQKGRNNWASNYQFSCGPSTSTLPSAIVHPLGLESSSKFSAPNGTGPTTKLTVENLLAANVMVADEKNAIESTSIPAMSYNEDNGISNETSMENNPELLMQVYMEIGDQLKNLGYSTKNKSIMHAASRLREEEETSSATYSPEPNEDSGDYASLPFKKRRKLHSNDDQGSRLIKEEDMNSRSPFDSPRYTAPISREIETTPTTIQRNATSLNAHSIGPAEENQPIAQLAAYPSTQMLSIANVIEYLPIRAYSTLKTPAPEIAPVHFNNFNILPSQQTIVNPSLYPNVLATQNTAAQGPVTNAPHSQSNQHVEYERTFNIIPPQQTKTSKQSNSMSTASANMPVNCSIVDGEPYLTQQIQTIATDNNASNGYNLTKNNPIQYHQTFHSNNQPYAATYSIQPTPNTTNNNLAANFDLQNMFNLRNYQMNPQNYHNLVQNSRINLQEKQAILLNDLVNSFSEGNQYDGQQQNFQQHQHQQQSTQTLNMSQITSVESKSSSTTMNKTMALRTKAARKIIPDLEPSAENQKRTNEKEEYALRRSNRTTRAQNLLMDHKSPPTLKSSTKRESKSRKHKAQEPIMISNNNNAYDVLKKKKNTNSK